MVELDSQSSSKRALKLAQEREVGRRSEMVQKQERQSSVCCRASGTKGEIVLGMLFKLLVKDKLIYSEKNTTKLTAETSEKRETSIQRMSTNQHGRLTVETPEEREMMLLWVREKGCTLPTSLSLIERDGKMYCPNCLTNKVPHL